VIGAAPVQVPVAAVSVAPWSGVPEIDGAVVLTGGEPATVALAGELAEATPAAFVAVTTTTTV
jgi:organic radical activating enzyme